MIEAQIGIGGMVTVTGQGGMIEAQIGVGGMVGWAWEGLSGRTF